MEFTQWSVISFLNSLTETCLSFGSISLNVNLTCLCGLCLLLLFLCYLVGISSSPTVQKCENIPKNPSRAKRRRKGGTWKGWSYDQREEEKRRLISILRSPLGQHHDATHFRHLLCPDPVCKVCNDAAAEVNCLLFPETLEDSTPSVSSLVSTAPETDSSFSLCPASSPLPPADLLPAPLPVPFPSRPPILSSNPMAPLSGFLSPSPLGQSLPPEPFPPLEFKFPVDSSSFHHLGTPPYGTQRADPLLRPEATLTLHTIFLDPSHSPDTSPFPDSSHPVNPPDSAWHHVPAMLSTSPPADYNFTVTESQSVSILLKPDLQNTSQDRPGALSTYVPTVTGIDHSSQALPDFSWRQAHAKDSSPSTLARCDINEEFLAIHSSEASPAASVVECGHLFFVSPDILAFLERQVLKRRDFLMWKEKEKKNGSLSKQLGPEYHLNSSGKVLESAAAKHDPTASLPFRSSQGKPKKLRVHLQPSRPKTWEDYLMQKHTQLFWGFPSLHSESLPSVVHGLGDYSSIFIFNRISNASTGQEYPVLFHPLPPSLPEVQHQPFAQTLPQSQHLPTTQVLLQAHPPPSLPILPSGPIPQTKTCGVHFHQPRNESECLTSTEIQNLEWNVLHKQQGILWGLPSVVQRSQEDFCPSAPIFSYHRSSRAHVPISILAGDFPFDSKLRDELEHHLRKRLIQHRWGLPRRIHESLSLMRPLTGSSEIPELKSNYGLSWISVYKGQSSQNLTVELSQPRSLSERGSERLQLEAEEGNDNGNSPEKGPKDNLFSDSKSSSNKDVVHDSAEDSHMVSQSEKTTMVSGQSLGQRQLEKVLKVQSSKNFEEINESQLPASVHSPWHATQQTPTLSGSHTEIKQRSLPPSVGGDSCLDTWQGLSFIESSAQQMLEDHIKRFRLRMLWGLPSKVRESTEIFQSRDSSSHALLHSNLPSSTNPMSVVNTKSGGSMPLRGRSQFLRGEKVETANSAPVLDRFLLATSHMGKKGQGTMTQ